jgi:transcriptional regulator with XRE-family HTH domain
VSRCSAAGRLRDGRTDTPAFPYCGLVLTAKTPTRGYPEELVTVADHIRKGRLDQGLTQRQLAKLFGVSMSSVNNWERGRNFPDLRVWPKLIAWLGYNPEPEGTTLGERVARRRRELGLNQEELARRLGTDEGSIQAWEGGETQPNKGSRLLLERFERRRERRA